jgi:hypothetical protein
MKYLVLLAMLYICKAQQPGYLSVSTDIPNAPVYINSRFIGYTPVVNFPISPGRSTLRVKNPDYTNWYARDIVMEIDVSGGDTLELNLKFERFIKINSNPFGATVSLNDSILGTTPVILKAEKIIGKKLKLSRSGYEDMEIIVDEKSFNISVDLIPMDSSGGELRIKEENKFHLIIPIAIIGLASGLTSIYFKMNADKFYEQYLEIQDPTLLDKTRRYDKAAGIALVIFEISMAISIYLLLSKN